MRTLVAFCGTFAPAAIIAVGSTLRTGEALVVARTTVVAALAAVSWGAVQLASANSTGLLFPIPAKPDVLYAVFANRNSAALFFVLALLLTALIPWRRRGWQMAAIGGAVLLALGAVLTQSRSGMALLALALGFIGMREIWRRGRSRRWLGLAAIAGVAVLGLAIATSGAGRLGESASRLATTETDRPEMWQDALYAARYYAPLGSGMGTFDEVFQLHESLEYVSPRRAGRAHSDWLEIAIEGGVVALMLAVGWLLWCGQAALRPSTGLARWQRVTAGVGIACIALQSLLDYPLRNQTLLCVAALLVVLLACREEGRE